MLKVGTVCTGIGSPEQAIKELNIPHEIVFACEKDKYARQTYLANFKPDVMLNDMTDGEINKYYCDILLGGIPCQSFSLAGKRLGELDPRGLLFYNFYDYVKIQKPKYFIIENVKGLLSDQSGKTFNTWLELLGQSVNYQYNMINQDDSLLYNLHWTVLNSKNFGVPQNRERVFLIGIRNDLPNNFSFPIGQHLKLKLKDILEPIVDEKYYLSEKAVSGLMKSSRNRITDRNEIISPILQSNQAKQSTDSVYIKEPQILTSKRTEYGKQTRKDYETRKIELQRNEISELIPREDGVTNTISTVTKDNLLFEPICVAMRGRNPENTSDRTTGSPTQQTLEPNSQGITNTITSVQKDNLIQQDYRIRRLTPTECFRLQGFPDSFIKPISESQQYKQAGNTITVNVIKAILSKLLM